MSSMNGVKECPAVRSVDSRLHGELMDIIGRLESMRAVKSGKKTYDYVVAGYFEDMVQVLAGAWAVLKPGGRFILVLGDSARVSEIEILLKTNQNEMALSTFSSVTDAMRALTDLVSDSPDIRAFIQSEQ